MNIYINDIYLDFTYSNSVSIERRFFIEFENNSKTQEVFVFMSELNSLFEMHKILKNVVILENKDLEQDYLERDKKFSSYQTNKSILSIDKQNIYTSLGKQIVEKISSFDENDWLKYCQKRYNENKVELTEQLREKELKKFQLSNQILKKIWSEFPYNFKNFDLSGDMDKALTIPEKYAQFLKEIQYHHLNNILPEQGKINKKMKI